METSIIKSYSTQSILPYGKGLVFVAAWNKDGKFYCERFVFFEGPAHGWLHSGMSTNVSQDAFTAFNQFQSENQALTAYMDCEGRQFAESELYNLFMQEASSKVKSKLGHVADITLKPSNYIGDLLYLKTKFSEGFGWLLSRTKSTQLKNDSNMIYSLRVKGDKIY